MNARDRRTPRTKTSSKITDGSNPVPSDKTGPLIAEEMIVPISDVIAWDKNPRGIMKSDFERLKRQIIRLGVYKRLLCYRENGKYVVLGGNMRLRALQDLRQSSVAISIVHPKSESQKLEFSLSDNDRAGYYEDQKLAELAFPFRDMIPLEDFRVDLSAPVDVAQIVAGFGPSGIEDPEFVEESDRRTISIFCQSDEELLEMRDRLGIADQKSNKIEALALKALLR